MFTIIKYKKCRHIFIDKLNVHILQNKFPYTYVNIAH